MPRVPGVAAGAAGSRDRREAEVESQLRHGAAFCRRVAVVALLIGFAGSMAVGFALERGSAEGLGLPALLAIMVLSILVVLLFVCLFLMLGRTMEGLAGLVARTERLGGAIAALEAGGWEASLGGAGEGGIQGRAGPGEPGRGVSVAAPPAAPGPGGPAPSSPGTAPGRPASLAGAVETIRMGGFVKVTTADGWTGWVRDAELPPAAVPLPRTAAGAPYRPPLPSLRPGKAARAGPEGE